MRVLLAASGGEGHLGPLLPFATAARAAGDDVLVVVPPEQQVTVQALGLPHVLTPGVPPEVTASIRVAMAAGSAADRVRLAEVDLFGRACTEAALPATEAACAQFRPQLILREPCDYASAIAAHRRRVPMAQIAVSPGSADWNGLHLAAAVIEPRAPGVTAAVEAAPHLSRFLDPGTDFADTRLYGFAVDTGPRRTEDPPLVWITFGTVNSAFAALDTTWRTVLDAVEGLPLRVIASTGRGVALRARTGGAEIVEWIELADVLSRASAVVCHGGSGTTLAALAAGTPLVVIPLIADQPANAAMVEALGAGIAIAPVTAPDGSLLGLCPDDAPRVRDALSRVLCDDAYTRAAQHVAQRLAARESVPAALQRLRDALPRDRQPPTSAAGSPGTA